MDPIEFYILPMFYSIYIIISFYKYRIFIITYYTYCITSFNVLFDFYYLHNNNNIIIIFYYMRKYGILLLSIYIYYIIIITYILHNNTTKKASHVDTPMCRLCVASALGTRRNARRNTSIQVYDRYTLKPQKKKQPHVSHCYI